MIHRVKVERNNNWGRNLSSFSSTSCGTSVASSECSDEPLVDIETDQDDGFFSIPSSDASYLTTSLLNVFDEGVYKYMYYSCKDISNLQFPCDLKVTQFCDRE